MDPEQHPIALIAALELEARGVARHLTRAAGWSPQLAVWEGVLEKAQVVLVVSGVGKVAASLATQFVCDVYRPRCAITFGLAGGIESDSRAGRLIVASGAVQHDMDARPLTAGKGVIPSFGQALFSADGKLSKTLRNAAEQAVGDAEVVTSGLVLTGDQIVTSRAVRDALLQDFPEGACIDMETAAIAQVAHQNGLPWAGLRMTSDSADETFNLEQVVGFGVDTAADLFDRIIQAFARDSQWA